MVLIAHTTWHHAIDRKYCCQGKTKPKPINVCFKKEYDGSFCIQDKNPDWSLTNHSYLQS